MRHGRGVPILQRQLQQSNAGQCSCSCVHPAAIAVPAALGPLLLLAAVYLVSRLVSRQKTGAEHTLTCAKPEHSVEPALPLSFIRIGTARQPSGSRTMDSHSLPNPRRSLVVQPVRTCGGLRLSPGHTGHRHTIPAPCAHLEPEYRHPSPGASPSQGIDMTRQVILAAAQCNNSQEPANLAILSLLGQGTYGSVYKASWKGIVVAVKIMVLTGSDKREKMAIMEAAISSSLSHPNIVQTYTFSVQALEGQRQHDDRHSPLQHQASSLPSGQCQPSRDRVSANPSEPPSGAALAPPAPGAMHRSSAPFNMVPRTSSSSVNLPSSLSAAPQAPARLQAPHPGSFASNPAVSQLRAADLHGPGPSRLRRHTSLSGLTMVNRVKQALTPAGHSGFLMDQPPSASGRDAAGETRRNSCTGVPPKAQSLQQLIRRNRTSEAEVVLRPQESGGAPAAAPSRRDSEVPDDALGHASSSGLGPKPSFLHSVAVALAPDAGPVQSEPPACVRLAPRPQLPGLLNLARQSTETQQVPERCMSTIHMVRLAPPEGAAQDGGPGGASPHAGVAEVGAGPQGAGGSGSWEVRLVQEFCEAGSLRDLLDKGGFAGPDGTVDLRAMLDTAMDIARAMEHLHAQHIVHSDLKPRNVLLKANPLTSRGFIAKVADFGLSVRLQQGTGHINNVFQGTLSHMAPEVLLHGQLGKPVDVFAFGMVLWECYTAERAYRGMSKRSLIEAMTRHGLRPTFPPGAPPALAALATQCWAMAPAARPTFTEVLEALQGMAACGPDAPGDAALHSSCQRYGAASLPPLLSSSSPRHSPVMPGSPRNALVRRTSSRRLLPVPASLLPQPLGSGAVMLDAAAGGDAGTGASGGGGGDSLIAGAVGPVNGVSGSLQSVAGSGSGTRLRGASVTADGGIVAGGGGEGAGSVGTGSGRLLPPRAPSPALNSSHPSMAGSARLNDNGGGAAPNAHVVMIGPDAQAGPDPLVSPWAKTSLHSLSAAVSGSHARLPTAGPAGSSLVRVPSPERDSRRALTIAAPNQTIASGSAFCQPSTQHGMMLISVGDSDNAVVSGEGMEEGLHGVGGGPGGWQSQGAEEQAEVHVLTLGDRQPSGSQPAPGNLPARQPTRQTMQPLQAGNTHTGASGSAGNDGHKTGRGMPRAGPSRLGRMPRSCDDLGTVGSYWIAQQLPVLPPGTTEGSQARTNASAPDLSLLDAMRPIEAGTSAAPHQPANSLASTHHARAGCSSPNAGPNDGRAADCSCPQGHDPDRGMVVAWLRGFGSILAPAQASESDDTPYSPRGLAQTSDGQQWSAEMKAEAEVSGASTTEDGAGAGHQPWQQDQRQQQQHVANQPTGDDIESQDEGPVEGGGWMYAAYGRAIGIGQEGEEEGKEENSEGSSAEMLSNVLYHSTGFAGVVPASAAYHAFVHCSASGRTDGAAPGPGGPSAAPLGPAMDPESQSSHYLEHSSSSASEHQAGWQALRGGSGEGGAWGGGHGGGLLPRGAPVASYASFADSGLLGEVVEECSDEGLDTGRLAAKLAALPAANQSGTGMRSAQSMAALIVVRGSHQTSASGSDVYARPLGAAHASMQRSSTSGAAGWALQTRLSGLMAAAASNTSQHSC